MNVLRGQNRLVLGGSLHWIFHTGIAANLLGRRFLGIDREEEYLILSKNRKKEIEQIAKFSLYHKKIKDISLLNNAERMSVHEKEVSIYDLPF